MVVEITTPPTQNKPNEPLPGEFEVIRRYFAPLAQGMPGALALTDDACTWQPPAGEDLVLTADALIADLHFLRSDPPDLIARKMLRVNLSDLAAKGARPVGYLMTIAIDSTIQESWIRDFVRGLAEDQQLFNVHLMGGDTVKTPGPLNLSLTAIGTVPAGSALRRNGAKPGHHLFVTGTIGDGYLGLQILRGKFLDLDEAGRSFLARRYQLPEPRLAFGRALRHHAIASAAMDVSDGLVADLEHLTKASACGAVLHSMALPLSIPATELVAQNPDLLLDLMTGGDDYEILFAVPAEKVTDLHELAQHFGHAVTEIGTCVPDGGVTVIDQDKKIIQLKYKGYSHF